MNYYPNESKIVKALEAIGGFFLDVLMLIAIILWKVGIPLGLIFVVVYLAVKAAS